MHLTYAAVLLLLLGAGCAPVEPDTRVSDPGIVATQPDTPQPTAEPAAPPTPQPEPAAAPAPQIVATRPDTPQPAAKPAAPLTPQPKPAAARATDAETPAPRAAIEIAPPVATTRAAAPALDLNALEEQLRETKAIGIFTKITLKNQVDDLLDRFRDFHQGKAKATKTDLRRSYDLLMMKVLSLVQDEDQRLASAIVSSREAIWGLLEDPKEFATLQG